MIVTVTNTGYIKRVPLSTYRAQRRGGKGRSAMSTKEEDFVTTIFSSNTHTPIVFFTNKGMAYKLKVYKLPLGSPQSLGKALINLLPLDQGENVTAIMPLPEDEDTWEELHVMFATSKGTVRRNKLSDFTGIRANGKIAMKLNEGDYLVDVKVCNENQDVFLALKNGKCIRFKVTDIRVFTGRNSVGVRGIKVSGDDKVISMSILDHVEVDTDTRYAYLKKSKALRRIEGEEELEGENTADEDVKDIEIDDATFEMMQEKEEFILTVTESGFGKRTSAYEYRVTGRGGSGLANIKIAGRNKHVVASFPVEEEHDLILVTDQGKLIRMPIETIRIAGRQTMGVTLFRVNNNEKVVSAVAVEKEEDEPENEAEQDNQGNTDLQSDQTPQKENMVTEEKTQVVEETNKEKPDEKKQETEDASDDQNNDSEEDDGNMNLF
jgi:DNA gyrase subunit A